MSSRKAAKSFASLVTDGWQFKERMGRVRAPFHILDLLWDQNSKFWSSTCLILGSTDQIRTCTDSKIGKSSFNSGENKEYFTLNYTLLHPWLHWRQTCLQISKIPNKFFPESYHSCEDNHLPTLIYTRQSCLYCTSAQICNLLGPRY